MSRANRVSWRALLGGLLSVSLLAAGAAGQGEFVLSLDAAGGGGAAADELPPAGGPREGIVVALPTVNVQSWDLLGDPDNVVWEIDAASLAGLAPRTPLLFIGIGWDRLCFETLRYSWFSEVGVYFDDRIAPDHSALLLRPGVCDCFYFCSWPESDWRGPWSSGSVIRLKDVQIPEFRLPDGFVRIEFFESVDNTPDAVEAYWRTGELWIEVKPVGEPCPADIDADGEVDFNDLRLVLEDFGCRGAACRGDVDIDGDTDFQDVVALLADFGTRCS